VYDFLFVIIELFSLALIVETLQEEICRRERFLKGWVTLIAHFRWKGTSPTDHCWVETTRRITLSCGTKISPIGSLHYSQSTRVTDGRTDGHNYHSQDRASIAASRGKNR